MQLAKTSKQHRPREWRRRVLLSARVRTTAGWGDVRILNVSSRGLLIQAPSIAVRGDTVELKHGDQAIVARIVWRDGTRAGLSAEDRIPIEQILAFGQSITLQAVAKPAEERRRRRRINADFNRLQGRALEFLSVTVIVTCIGLALASIVGPTLARPLNAVWAALNG